VAKVGTADRAEGVSVTIHEVGPVAAVYVQIDVSGDEEAIVEVDGGDFGRRRSVANGADAACRYLNLTAD
jgi:hypothetical protein